MSLLRAVLAFPVAAPGAARVLAGRPAAGLVALLPGLAATIALWARGAAPLDAAATGGAFCLLVLGLGAGGAAGSVPAAMLLGRGGGRPLAPCLVFATWTAVLFPLALWLARLLGAGSKAALFAGLSVLVWGVVSGIGVVGGDRDAEDYGRAVVASCIGLAGALALLWGALVLVQAHLLLGVPAPVDVDGFRPGDLLLVRRDAAPAAGTLVLLRDAASREAVLARRKAGGAGYEPVRVDPHTWTEGEWTPVGRVFYGFGRKWGGRPVGAADDNGKGE